ncbi:YcjF family protein [Paracoccus aerodenitrificans]|uniref:YcjF family protein n=1 Tax=Paracoccus aerodenitrificans TaxID=3017781 RepID=UPI0022EFFC37|nr:TIGR01620 family protein [Paracoccus aerodenitrificans]WBU62895.1 TIGR01620 family protein [Paracoccus aerodenitrificans]
MSDQRRKGPVLVELEDSAGPDPRRTAPKVALREDEAEANPADAPPIEDAASVLPRPRTMELVTRLAGRGPSRLTRFFINTGAALLTFLLSVSALNYINRLLDSWPVLGWIGVTLFALFTVAVLAMAWREYRAWGRFAQIDQIHRQAGLALSTSDLEGARSVVAQLDRIYAERPAAQWGRDHLARHGRDALDAQTLLTLAETQLMAPLDQEARREIEAAARTVATATALIPLTFADVAAALLANLRMIRRMAEIYGGRAGAVGGWRLARTVMTHLIATGAVAAGDDLVHTLAGGGLVAKLSRRFGEGVVNGALTARVGIAAMEVCRPLPFIAQPRPKVGNLVSRGLAGLFSMGNGEDAETTASASRRQHGEETGQS